MENCPFCDSSEFHYVGVCGRFVASRGKSAVFELALELALHRLKSAGAGGDPFGGFPAPSAINFGVQGSATSPFFPVPVGNTGTNF